LPRSLRDKINEVKSVAAELRGEFSREPNEEELAQRLHISSDEVRSLLFNAQQAEMVSLEEELQKTVGASEPEQDSYAQGLEDGELCTLLAEAIQTLDEKERVVLSMYYYEEMNLKEIGRVMGLSESRISQLLGKAIMLLQEKMQGIRSEIHEGLS
jgi:RNA polymerase sigma factor FliA